MASRSLWSLYLLLALLLPREVLSQGDLNLSDALGDDDDSELATPSPKPAAPAAPGGGAGDGFDLTDALDHNNDIGGKDKNKEATPSPKPAAPAAPGGGVLGPKDFKFDGTTTTKAPPKVVPKVPKGTKDPVKPKPMPAGDGFDLTDALDHNNDTGGKDKNKGQEGGHPSGDSDPINQYDDNTETTAEVGTIAGIVSAVAMALVGAVSSYISYQKKKLCFGIQQSLNTDMVKAENPDAVVATEPQVQQTLLEPPNAEPPTEENAV